MVWGHILCGIHSLWLLCQEKTHYLAGESQILSYDQMPPSLFFRRRVQEEQWGEGLDYSPLT